MITGTQGYAEQAEALIQRYEDATFEHKHRAEMHLLPPAPVRALDIGAGTGADAAWLADRGHDVLVVEPTHAFREAGQRLHPHPRIRWINDSLPRLEGVTAAQQQFGLIMLTAVWMHLDDAERELAMRTIASLLGHGGCMLMSLRHGPVPNGRRMFDVQPQEVIDHAANQGLACVLNVHTESSQSANREAGISWSRLGFTWPLGTPRHRANAA